MNIKMKKIVSILILTMVILSSCNSYNALYKSRDYEYKYEAAKEYYYSGYYTRCYQLLEEMTMMMKGTDKAEESLFMLGMCYYNLHDYVTAAEYFTKYYKSYPKGTYTELARYYSGLSAFKESPDSRLDQTPTYSAINTLQEFLEFYPYSERRTEVNDMIFQLQNRLVEKEFDAAKLYFNLGSYVGNCTYGGNNYEACIITAENALKSYPYTEHREELYWLILKCRYELATRSVESKAIERYRECVDEYYGFKNEFPASSHIKEADQIFKRSQAKLKNVNDEG